MLVYTGGGYGGWLHNIPARDLTDEEVKRFGGENELIKTGLYEKPKRTSTDSVKPADKEKS